MRRAVFLFLSLLCASALQAGGETGADAFQAHPSARASAMGGAYVGLGDDLGALSYNPAGLNQLKGPSLSFLHEIGVASLTTENVAYGQSLGFGAAAGSLLYRSQDDINNPLATDAPVQSYDVGLTASFATRPAQWAPNLPGLLANVDAGASLKYLRSHLGRFDSDAFALDLGLREDLGEGLIGGLSVLNLGPPVHFISVGDPLPTTILVGVARSFDLFARNHLTISGDAEDPIYSSFRGHLGLEDWLGKALAVRLGYVLDSAESLSGLSAGFGLRLDQEGLLFQFDYAYLPFYYDGFNSYEGQHQFQMSLVF